MGVAAENFQEGPAAITPAGYDNQQDQVLSAWLCTASLLGAALLLLLAVLNESNW